MPPLDSSHMKCICHPSLLKITQLLAGMDRGLQRSSTEPLPHSRVQIPAPPLISSVNSKDPLHPEPQSDSKTRHCGSPCAKLKLISWSPVSPCEGDPCAMDGWKENYRSFLQLGVGRGLPQHV